MFVESRIYQRNHYQAVPKKKRAPSSSTKIVIDIAHWRALKSPSTVVRSIEEVPEVVQFDIVALLNDSVTSLTIAVTVELVSTSPIILGAVLNVSFRISEIWKEK